MMKEIIKTYLTELGYKTRYDEDSIGCNSIKLNCITFVFFDESIIIYYDTVTWCWTRISGREEITYDNPSIFSKVKEICDAYEITLTYAICRIIALPIMITAQVCMSLSYVIWSVLRK